MEKLKAIGYIRYNENQESVEGLNDRMNTIEEYMASKGFTKVGIYADSGSGLNKERPELNRILDNLENRNYDVVVVNGLQSLSRDPVLVAHIVMSFTEHGIKLYDIKYDREVIHDVGKFSTMMSLASVMKKEEEDKLTPGELVRIECEINIMENYLFSVNHHMKGAITESAMEKGINISLGDHTIHLPLNSTTYCFLESAVAELRNNLGIE